MTPTTDAPGAHPRAGWLPVVGRWRPDPELVTAVRVGALVLFWLFACSTAVAGVRGYVFDGFAPLGVDAHAYWVAGRSAHPYDQAPGFQDAFLYSPIFAQAVHPFAALPFPVFFGAWMAMEAGLFAWLVFPLPVRWAVPLWLFCVPELLLGNVVGFLALAAVLGVRRPAAWSFPLLTKITPGGLGLAWFAARGEWRQLTRAVLVTLALVAVSVAVSPGLWADWFGFLRDQGGGSGGAGALARACLATALVVAGARNGRAWVIGPAMLVCTPVLGGVNALAMLTAVPRLVAERRPPVPRRRSNSIVGGG